MVDALGTLSGVIGWSYFTAWSASFYPQVESSVNPLEFVAVDDVPHRFPDHSQLSPPIRGWPLYRLCYPQSPWPL